MANLTTKAGNNGVAGNTSTTTAIRTSVARTSVGYGTTVAASTVYSETPNLRFAYEVVEADAPARTRA